MRRPPYPGGAYSASMGPAIVIAGEEPYRLPEQIRKFPASMGPAIVIAGERSQPEFASGVAKLLQWGRRS